MQTLGFVDLQLTKVLSATGSKVILENHHKILFIK